MAGQIEARTLCPAGPLGTSSCEYSFSFAISWEMAWIGMTIKDVQAASVAGFVPILIMTFTGGGLVPVGTLPGWLQAFAHVQPALKCRGREYLRIIYGPEYTAPQNLERLRSRGVGAKRALAAREFALGLEALERFVAHEPLRRVHECVFGVLALESEPVDPRL